MSTLPVPSLEEVAFPRRLLRPGPLCGAGTYLPQHLHATQPVQWGSEALARDGEQPALPALKYTHAVL